MGTMRQYNIIAISLLVKVCQVSTVGQCFDPSAIKPHCSLSQTNYIECNDIRDIDSVRTVLDAIKKCNVSMQFTNLVLEKLPRGLFNGTSITSLVFKNFSLSMLADDEPGPSPFLGLENTLHTLGIVGSRKSIRQWNWKELSELRSLETISIGRDHFFIVPKAFSQVNGSSLSRLQLTGSCIDEIEDHAFDNFPHLETLTLEANRLISIRRATFPVQARKLRLISLRHNLLDLLEIGTFNNLPSLRNLYLDFNRFSVIQESVFFRLWSQLDYLLFYENPIHCDCKISWILERKPIYMRNNQPLRCEQPIGWKGTDVRRLKKDIICSFRTEKHPPMPADEFRRVYKSLDSRCSSY